MELTFESSDQSPKSLSDPPETCAAPADIQPDPLLGFGAFIDATVTPGLQAEPEPTEESPNPDLRRSSATGTEAPVPELATENTESPVQSRKRSRKRASEQSLTSAASDALAWLPSGWLVEDRVRTSGATAGVVDKYYVDPVSGHRFRSKKEVFRFLETGSKRKKNSTDSPDADSKAKDNPDADSKSTDTPRGTKQKGSGSRAKKKSRPLKFDYGDVPEAVRWVLTDVTIGTWTPFIGEEKVSVSSRKEWAAAFESVSREDSSELHTVL